jgi:hypothetical protein
VCLGDPVDVQFTRKVVVLAMGFHSCLDRRYLYWGNNVENSGRSDQARGTSTTAIPVSHSGIAS